MPSQVKINIKSNSRKGNSKIRAIVVVDFNNVDSMARIDKIAENAKQLQPDQNGILWFASQPDNRIRVYPIN